MMRKQINIRSLSGCNLLGVLACLMWICGCGDSKNQNPAGAPGGGHAHAHDHGAAGPHGGHIVEVSGSKFHAEWTHDDDGKIRVYILGADAKTDAGIRASSVTISTEVEGKEPSTYQLDAFPPGGGSGPHSAFETVNRELLTTLQLGDAVEATLIFVDGEQEYRGKLEHDHADDHQD